MTRLILFFSAFFAGALVRRTLAYAAVVYGFERLPQTNWAGIFYLVLLVPYLLFSVSAGVLLDVVPKRRVIQGATVLAAVAVTLLALAEHAGWFGATGRHALLLAGILGVYGTAYAVAYPAFISAVPDVVEPRRVAHTTIGVNVLALIALAYAPVIVGALREELSWPVLFGGFAIAAAVAVAGAQAVPLRAPAPRPQALDSGRLRELLRFCWAERKLRAHLVLALAFSFVVVGPLEVLLPQFAEGPLALSPLKAGTFVAIGGTGLVVGSLAALRIVHSPRVGTWQCAAAGTGALLVVLMTFLPLRALVVTFFVSGIMGGAFSSLNMAAIQANASAERRGGVMGIFALIFGGVPGLGGVAAGALATHVGPAAAIRVVFSAAGILFPLLYAMLPPLRALRTRGLIADVSAAVH